MNSMTKPFDLAAILSQGTATSSLIQLPPSKWKALQGGRLELNSTGFLITMTGNPKRHPYELTDPDGRLIVAGPELQPMKALAERWAEDRKEFEL